MNVHQMIDDLQQSGFRVKELWGEVAVHETTRVSKHHEQLIKLLQERYGCSRNEAETGLIALLTASLPEADVVDAGLSCSGSEPGISERPRSPLSFCSDVSGRVFREDPW